MVLAVALLLSGSGLVGLISPATPAADVEATAEASPVVIDADRSRHSRLVNRPRRAFPWGQRRLVRSSRPRSTATPLPATPRTKEGSCELSY